MFPERLVTLKTLKNIYIFFFNLHFWGEIWTRYWIWTPLFQIDYDTRQ